MGIFGTPDIIAAMYGLGIEVKDTQGSRAITRSLSGMHWSAPEAAASLR
jgi:hypothetical protein